MNEQEEEPSPAPVGYGLDVEGFMEGLEQVLNNNVAGYSVGLNENGSTIASATGGLAKYPQDGSEAWTLDTRMFVASLNKIVTAIAMTRLLVEAGISPDTPIIGYLPAYWVKSNKVDDITIANLLDHTSGLAVGDQSGRMDFQFMKEQIALGPTANLGTYQYQNVNYGLCRILLATINGNVPPSMLVWPYDANDKSSYNDALWDSSTISAYASYVASEVFAPSGVSGPGFIYDAADALAYNFPVTGHGANSGNQTEQAAFHMSVNELLKVMGTFRRGGTIVSPTQAQLMLENGFGLNTEPPPPTTLAGPYYVKLGGWNPNNAQQDQGLAFFLPQNMELVILVNSPITGETIGNGPTGDLLYQDVSAVYRNSIVDL